MRRCRICRSFRLKKVFSLGKQPAANRLLEAAEEAKTYPLDLYECQHCSLLQLGYVVPKEELYEEYYYVPSVSKTNMGHFKNLANKLISTLKLKPKSLVVDIGGNDGSLLDFFARKRMKVVNVEPAK